MRLMSGLAALLYLLPSLASDVTMELGELHALAVNKPLFDGNSKPLSVIRGTGTTELGFPMEGPQNAVLTLDPTADFPIIVAGVEIQPGETVSLKVTVADPKRGFEVPVYPGVEGVLGSAPFVMTIDRVYGRGCPDSYEFSEESCTQFRTMVVDWYCQDASYQLKSNQECHKPQYESMIKSCPSGFSLEYSSNTCSKFKQVVANKTCAAGFDLNSSSCIKLLTASLQFTCSSGLLHGEQCIGTTVTPATAYCANGYAQRNGRCELMLIEEPIYSCSGGTLSGGRCITQLTEPATSSCPVGFYSSGSSCNKQTTIAATAFCEVGTLSGASCVSIASKPAKLNFEYGCPDGGSLKPGNVCYQLYSSHKSMALPEGSGWDCTNEDVMPGEPATLICERTYSASMMGTSYSCETGWSVIGSNCQKSTSTAVAYSCTSGYTLSGSNCLRNTTTGLVYSCANGTLSGNVCLVSNSSDAEMSCASGFSINETSCTKLLLKPYDYQCSSGWDLSGSSCSQATSSAATPFCEPDYSISAGKCIKTLVTSVDYECEPGWVLSGSKCSTTLKQAAIQEGCPIGSQPHQGDQCINMLIVSALPRCESPYLFDSVNLRCEYTDIKPIGFY
ncbi:hypothetical protein [Ferrimonas kyonanensis]|uniref:hypothetical protein n=1 Tax=Ferrimonas kyonanensis TaxID=364763 RepID=UPI000416C2EE|nr:hypothetical protein [Ferrimonas kyonanensis]